MNNAMQTPRLPKWATQKGIEVVGQYKDGAGVVFVAANLVEAASPGGAASAGVGRADSGRKGGSMTDKERFDHIADDERRDNPALMCQDMRRSAAYPGGCLNESSEPCDLCGDPMCPDHLECVMGRKVCHACVLKESFDLLAKGEEILRANGEDERADTLAAGALQLQIGAIAVEPVTAFQISVCHDPICSAAVDFERWALEMLKHDDDPPPNFTMSTVTAVMRQFVAWALREKRMEVMFENIEGTGKVN